MAGRSWPSLTSDVLEHEWISVHQQRLDRKRRRRASLPMRPPYCLVIRLNVAVNRALSKSGQVSWLHRSFSLIRRGRTSLSTENHDTADRTTRVLTRPPLSPPSCAPRTALVHRSVAAAEYITDPMMQLITSGNDQSESTSGLFIPIRG
jgi:hypothetical protein